MQKSGAVLERVVNSENYAQTAIQEEQSEHILDSFDELKKCFPASEYFLEHKKLGRKGYDVYSIQNSHGKEDIAYGCPFCKKIILGSPIKEEDGDSLNEVIITIKSTYLYCHNCNSRLGEDISWDDFK